MNMKRGRSWREESEEKDGWYKGGGAKGERHERIREQFRWDEKELKMEEERLGREKGCVRNNRRTWVDRRDTIHMC